MLPFDHNGLNLHACPWALQNNNGGIIFSRKCGTLLPSVQDLNLDVKYVGIKYKLIFSFSKSLQIKWQILCSFINCGVKQGFLGPEKSRNNTREKLSYFFTCVDIANQLLTRHSPLAPLGQVDEWTAKPSRFLMKELCRNFLELWRLKHKKISYRWQTLRFKLF